MLTKFPKNGIKKITPFYFYGVITMRTFCRKGLYLLGLFTIFGLQSLSAEKVNQVLKPDLRPEKPKPIEKKQIALNYNVIVKSIGKPGLGIKPVPLTTFKLADVLFLVTATNSNSSSPFVAVDYTTSDDSGNLEVKIMDAGPPTAMVTRPLGSNAPLHDLNYTFLVCTAGDSNHSGQILGFDSASTDATPLIDTNYLLNSPSFRGLSLGWIGHEFVVGAVDTKHGMVNFYFFNKEQHLFQPFQMLCNRNSHGIPQNVQFIQTEQHQKPEKNCHSCGRCHFPPPKGFWAVSYSPCDHMFNDIRSRAGKSSVVIYDFDEKNPEVKIFDIEGCTLAYGLEFLPKKNLISENPTLLIGYNTPSQENGDVLEPHLAYVELVGKPNKWELKEIKLTPAAPTIVIDNLYALKYVPGVFPGTGVIYYSASGFVEGESTGILGSIIKP